MNAVPLRAIAQAAGTTVGSVSRVLNGRQGPSEALRERVLKAARSLGHAATVAPPRRLLVLLPRAAGSPLRDPLVRGVLQGVEAACRAAQASLALLTLGAGDPVEALLQREAPHALLVIGALEAALLARLRAAGAPLALVDHVVPDLPVFADDLHAAAQGAWQHLAGLGRQRIAFVGAGLPASALLSLQRGYRRALFDAGRPADPDLEAVVGRLPAGEAALTAQLDAWWRRPDPPEALFAAGEGAGPAVLRWARLRALPVPRALAVLGLGDDEEAARADLCNLRTDRERLGVCAAEALLRGATPMPSSTLLPLRLVPRASTAPRSFPGADR